MPKSTAQILLRFALTFFLMSISHKSALGQGCVNAKHNLSIKNHEFADHDEIYTIKVDQRRWDLKIYYSESQEQTIKEMQAETCSPLQINAGFFDSDRRPIGGLYIGGQWVSMPYHKWHSVVFNNHSFETMVPNPKLNQIEQNFDFALSGYPRLIQNSFTLEYEDDEADHHFFTNRYARTALCSVDEDHWLFVVVGGSSSFDRITGRLSGLTISQLQRFLALQGCAQALNFDGGSSSAMVFNGELINNPAFDIKSMTHLRTLSTSFYLKSASDG